MSEQNIFDLIDAEGMRVGHEEKELRCTMHESSDSSCYDKAKA